MITPYDPVKKTYSIKSLPEDLTGAFTIPHLQSKICGTCGYDFNEFLKIISEYSKKDDVFIIGGASIYNQTLPYVDEVLLTKVNADGGAEVFFTNLDEHPDFECVEESEPILDSNIEIKFTKYKNNNKKSIC